MNIGAIVDGVAGIVLIFFLYRGLVKGFSGEIIGLVGFFVSTFCAWKFTEPAMQLVYRYMGHVDIDESVIAIMCGVSIFFIVEIIFTIVGAILSYLVKVTQLSLTDHIFGMLIGLCKTCFIVLVVYAVLVSFSGLVPSEWMKDSYAMTAASYVWPPLRDFLEAHGLLDLSALTGGV